MNEFNMLPIVYHQNYSYLFPKNHRFVMSKFANLFHYLKEEGIVKNNIYTPKTTTFADLSSTHDRAYLDKLYHNKLSSSELRRIGLPWSKPLMKRTFIAPNGTLLAAKLALEYGVACHLAGGTHHAHFDFGSGFCMLNDLAYTAIRLLEGKHVKRILVFDCDVHQGDGTAAILASYNQIVTCSIHCEKNFPFRKSKSDYDIGLACHETDETYLYTVYKTLNMLVERYSPDIILYDAGVDVWQGDSLGKLDISWQGIERRDEMVFDYCKGKKIPVVSVIGGGYDKDHLALARRHGIVVKAATKIYR